jgi:hypothetical protein
LLDAYNSDEFAQASDAMLNHALQEYRDLVANYRSASNEIAGLQHGQGGGTVANMPPGPQRGRIATPEARRGLATGQRQYQNANALAEVLEGVGKSREDTGLQNTLAGVAETAVGSHVFGVRKIWRGVAGILNSVRLPQATQLKFAHALATIPLFASSRSAFFHASRILSDLSSESQLICSICSP